MAKQNLKILIIEDSEADYLITKGKLTEQQNNAYDIDWAQDYKNGLQTAQDNAHDIYLVDYTLGKETGLDFTKNIKKTKPNIPIVMLTGHDDLELSQKATQTGVTDYLVKDEITSSNLNRAIINALERKKIENALKNEKEYTSYIISSVGYLIIDISKDGVINRVNPAAEGITEFNQNELTGKNLLDLIVEDGIELDSLLRSEEAHPPFTIRTKNGSTRTIKMEGIHEFPNGQEKTRYVCIARDITDDLRQEEKKRQREKMAALGQLSGGIAHELNNMLQPILLLSEIIKDAVPEDNAIAHKNLDTIISASVKAANLVDDILAFSKKDTAEQKEYNARQVFEESCNFAVELIPKTVRVHMTGFDDASNDINARINKNDGIRIMTNLLVNACQAMNNNGIIETTFQAVNLIAEEATTLNLHAGKYAKIEVIDHGCGISEGDMQNIFNPFYSGRQVGEGTGLGLSIVYNIIQNWGGKIHFDSVIEEGTRCSVYIPSV